MSCVRPRGAARAALAIASAVAGALSVACVEPTKERPARPDLVLVSLDTFRADLLDLTRADGSPELPALARLAEQAILFDEAWAPEPFTLPSHMTLLTGFHPETHGVDDRGEKLSADLPTLAERLSAVGYSTAGVTCGPWLERGYGFGRGFDSYRNLSLKVTFAERVRTRVGQSLAALPAGGRPRFLFAHFFDAHGDWPRDGNRLSYFSPPEFRSDLDPPESALCGSDGECAIPHLMSMNEKGERPSKELAALHFELYRRGARALDAELSRFFDELRERKLWDDALVVVTADHGEEFGEHGGFVHTQVYRESLRVPLLVKLPHGERGGTRERRRVALEDVAPTLLALAGIAPPKELDGFDLLGPAHQESERPIVSRRDGKRRQLALRFGSRLLVRDLGRNERLVYDLAADALELTALADAAIDPNEVTALEEKLDATLRRYRARRREPIVDRTKLDAKEAEDLRALGYLR